MKRMRTPCVAVRVLLSVEALVKTPKVHAQSGDTPNLVGLLNLKVGGFVAIEDAIDRRLTKH
jgi:hypothetical protein